MPVQNGPSLPLNKENGYLWLWSVVGMMFLFAIKLSSNELLCVHLRQTSLAQERSALRNAFTHPPRWYWGSFQKPPHSIPLPPVPNFVHALKLKFHSMQKFSKLNNNKIWWREHMAQTFILKTLNKFVSIIFPFFHKTGCNFRTGIHLSMAGSHDLWSEKCVWGCFESKTHCFNQIMLAPL